jgi:hypothetical protein
MRTLMQCVVAGPQMKQTHVAGKRSGLTGNNRLTRYPPKRSQNLSHRADNRRGPKGESESRLCYARLTRRCLTRAGSRTAGQTKNVKDLDRCEIERAVNLVHPSALCLLVGEKLSMSK